MFIVRKAKSRDVPLIYEMLKVFGQEGLMLPRSLSELYDVVRAFHVVFPEGQPTLAGACALQVCWEDLGEIRSLAVPRAFQGHDLGSTLMEACEHDAQELGLKRIFVLTYIPDYFQHHGYQLIDKSALPQKIWADCFKCVKFPECGEVALEKRL